MSSQTAWSGSRFQIADMSSWLRASVCIVRPIMLAKNTAFDQAMAPSQR